MMASTIRIEGPLDIKLMNTGYQMRYFVLNSKQIRLDYFLSKETKSETGFKGTIKLQGAVIILSKDDPAAFEVKTKESNLYKLRAMTSKDRKIWFDKLSLVSQAVYF